VQLLSERLIDRRSITGLHLAASSRRERGGAASGSNLYQQPWSGLQLLVGLQALAHEALPLIPLQRLGRARHCWTGVGGVVAGWTICAP
jgi:hypothetical protein